MSPASPPRFQRNTLLRLALILAATVVTFSVGAAVWWWRIYRASLPADDTSTLTCGGVAGLECPPGYVCQYPEETDVSDAAGFCIPAPTRTPSPSPSPTPTSPPTTPPTPAKTQTFTDASHLFTIDLPADWAITRNEGRKGIQLSFLGAQSPDFRVMLDETADEPFVPRRYERGAEFSVHVVRGRKEVVTEQSTRTVGLSESSPITIGGVVGTLRSGTGISTTESRNLDAIIHKDGLNYIFTFGYNSQTYPDGDVVFRGILASFQFAPATVPSPTAPPPAPARASPPPSPVSTPTASPYVYLRPNIGGIGP